MRNHYKMRQKFITKCVSFLLQNATGITKCDVYYKLQQYIAHLDRLNESLDTLSSDYERIIIFGDFNADIGENHIKSFRENYLFNRFN